MKEAVRKLVNYLSSAVALWRNDDQCVVIRLYGYEASTRAKDTKHFGKGETGILDMTQEPR